MNLLGIEVPAWAVLLLFILFILYHVIIWDSDYFNRICVRGPEAIPLIGQIYQLSIQPAAVYYIKCVKKYGKVFGAHIGLTPILHVADADFIKEITVKQFSKFTNRKPNGFTFGMMEMSLPSIHDDHWKHVRSLLSGTFSGGKLKQMLLLINHNVDDLVSNLSSKEGQEINIRNFTNAFTLDAVASSAFGMVIDSQRNPDTPLLKHVKEFLDIGLHNPITLAVLFFPTFGKFISRLGYSTVSRATTEYFKSMMGQRIADVDKDATGRDFIHLAVKHKITLEQVSESSRRTTGDKKWSTEGLTENEVSSNAMVFFVAGYDTTASLLQSALFSLARHPDVQQKLRDEVTEVAGDRVASYEELGKMEYMDWVINETLRMYSPAVMTDRECIEETTIKGIRIPKGCTLNLLIHPMHYDPDYWEEPYKFKPERFDPRMKSEDMQYFFMPFGSGPRHCIGMRLALLKAKAALTRIMQRFDVTPTPNTPEEPLELAPGSVIHAPARPILLQLNERVETVGGKEL